MEAYSVRLLHYQETGLGNTEVRRFLRRAVRHRESQFKHPHSSAPSATRTAETWTVSNTQAIALSRIGDAARGRSGPAAQYLLGVPKQEAHKFLN